MSQLTNQPYLRNLSRETPLISSYHPQTPLPTIGTWYNPANANISMIEVSWCPDGLGSSPNRFLNVAFPYNYLWQRYASTRREASKRRWCWWVIHDQEQATISWTTPFSEKFVITIFRISYQDIPWIRNSWTGYMYLVDNKGACGAVRWSLLRHKIASYRCTIPLVKRGSTCRDDRQANVHLTRFGVAEHCASGCW